MPISLKSYLKNYRVKSAAAQLRFIQHVDRSAFDFLGAVLAKLNGDPISLIDRIGLLIRLCRRKTLPIEPPLLPPETSDHWFIHFDRGYKHCGSIGLTGPTGRLIDDPVYNRGGQSINCEDLKADSTAESCVCRTFHQACNVPLYWQPVLPPGPDWPLFSPRRG